MSFPQFNSHNSSLSSPSVSLLAPATVANVVCGFDVLGFALHEPNDEMHLRLTDEPGVRIINDDDFGLPTEPARNVAGAALLAMLPPALVVMLMQKWFVKGLVDTEK